ncbi:MAG: hypothetical protein KF723_00375 [Rhizobiaceae bacterium]|nr:hypothetical protein [Rhizobiaceae bacterium]
MGTNRPLITLAAHPAPRPSRTRWKLAALGLCSVALAVAVSCAKQGLGGLSGDPAGVQMTASDAVADGADSKGGRVKTAFRPTLEHLMRPDALAVPVPLRRPDSGLETDELPAIAEGPLSHFQAKLAALESGTRTEPVTILHIGDSHVASDSFSRGIRTRLQTRFGDAGRGMVIPAGAFKYGIADQVTLAQTGTWDAATSLKEKTGPFGVSGVRLSSGSTSSTITMTSKTGPFDWAEVTVAGGSGAGSFEVSVDGRATRFTAEPGAAARTVRVSERGTALTVRPLGDGRVTVLNWSTGKERPGIRYVNFGLIGATVDVTRRWDAAIIANDLKALKPDLIVYGYGTNEGFNDNVDQQAYSAYAKSFVDSLLASAPGADVLFIGAADGARQGKGSACGGAWATPAKLETVRAAVRAVAANTSAGYWNWADAMGGRCGIDRWAQEGLAAKDRVHLTAEGYERSAEAFVHYLTAPVDAAISVAMNR